MASRLNPYVNVLDGKAREALEFYQSVLGGELNDDDLRRHGHRGRPSPTQVMHGQLETPDGFTLMVADAPPEMVQVTMGNNISVSLSGGDRGRRRAARLLRRSRRGRQRPAAARARAVG